MPANSSSPGLGVSLFASASAAVTPAGSSSLYLATIERASASVVGSGTVGPEPMADGSSPGTSEIAMVTSARRIGIARQPPAFDARQMFAHGIDLADARARTQQRARHRLLVGEGDAVRRRDPIGRGAARHQHQHQVILVGAVGVVRWRARGFQAAAVRHRMAGFDHGHDPGRAAIAVARHRNSTESLGG